MSRFVVSDIHGCLETFKEMIKQINFSKDDTLFILGDLIDRGPNSSGVIQLVIDMINQGYDIKCLMGNHEEFMVESSKIPDIKRMWFSNGGIKTLESYNAYNTAYSAPPWQDLIPKPHWDFLENLPDCILTDDYVFVHAYLDPTLDDPLETSPDNMRWGRALITNKAFKEKIGGRTLITGHTPMSSEDINELVTFNAPHIIVDAGCYFAKLPHLGCLCCLDLDSKRVTFVKNIDINQ